MTLPRGWAQAPIGSLCTLVNGRAFKPSEWSTSGLKIIRIQNLNREDADFNHFAGKVEDKHVVDSGDLLFAWSGTPGTSFGAHIWRGQQAVLNQHIFKVKYSKDLFDREFFCRAINVKLEELIGKAHGGAGLAHVTKGRFEETRVEIPPPAEQRRIVSKLRTLTKRIACARADLEIANRLAQAVRTKAAETAFAGETSAGIASQPSGAVTIQDLIIEGPNNGWSPLSGADASGALTLKLTATTSGRLRLDPAAVKRIYDTPPSTSKFWLQAGDLLIQRANALEHVGATAIFEGPPKTYIYPDLMMRIRVSDPKLTRILWYYFNSPRVRAHFRDKATGTAGNMPKISGAVVRSLTFPKLSKIERELTLNRLDTAFARADRLEAETARATALLDRLEASILAKAFRGELVPQDPADEPAAALLDRINAERAVVPKSRRSRAREGTVTSAGDKVERRGVG